jgi:hypothetical protein
MESIKKNFLAIFIIVVAIGAFARFYNLSATSFSADEFLGVNTAYGYLKTGEWRRWDFNLNKLSEDRTYAYSIFDLGKKSDATNGSYIRAWMYNWQVAQALKFMPASNESSFRFVSTLWGIVSIFLIYFIGKFFTKNKIIGLIAAFLFAISVSGIIFDRMVRMYAMVFPAYLIFSYLFYQFLESEKNYNLKFIKKIKSTIGLNFIYFIPLAIVGLISMHLHLLSGNIFLAVAAYLLANGIIQFSKTKKFWNYYTNYLVLAIVLFIIFLVTFPAQMSPFLNSFKLTNHFSYIEKMFSDYSNPLLAFLLVLLGGFHLWKNSRKEGIFLLSSLFVPFLAAIFLWGQNAGDQYVLFIKSFLIILIASGIYFAVEFCGTVFSKSKEKAQIIALALLLLLLPNYGYFFQENNAYQQTSTSSDPNYKKIFGYFLKNKQDGDILVTRWFRNYYFPKANVSVITFGGERGDKDIKKITGERLEEIQKTNPCGWFVWSDNDDDFITADAKDYARKNFEFVNSIAVRGNITVNHWCNK